MMDDGDFLIYRRMSSHAEPSVAGGNYLPLTRMVSKRSLNQYEERGGATFFFFAIENFVEGFILYAKIRRTEDREKFMEDHLLGEALDILDFSAMVRDEYDHEYYCSTPTGSYNDHVWTLGFTFSPSLALEAENLQMKISRARWMRFDDTNQKYVPLNQMLHEWKFNISLPTVGI